MSVLVETVAPGREAARPRPWLAVLHDWVVTVDHKRLGILYVVTGLGFLVVGGLEASMMRLQLAWSGLHVVPPETFNRLFTMHGTTMVFLVGIPLVFGFEVGLDERAGVVAGVAGEVRRQQVVDHLACDLHRPSPFSSRCIDAASASRARLIRDFTAPMLIPSFAATSAYDISFRT